MARAAHDSVAMRNDNNEDVVSFGEESNGRREDSRIQNASDDLKANLVR